MDIHGLPDEVTESHIVPALQQSLVSTQKFCDAGYRVEYTKDGCKYTKEKRWYYKGGRQDERVVDVDNQSANNEYQSTEKNCNYKFTTHVHSAAAIVYTLRYKKQQMKYMHQ